MGVPYVPVLGLVDSLMTGAEKKPRKKRAKGSYNDSEIARLRVEAKALGVNSYGKGRDDLRAAIAERKTA